MLEYRTNNFSAKNSRKNTVATIGFSLSSKSGYRVNEAEKLYREVKCVKNLFLTFVLIKLSFTLKQHHKFIQSNKKISKIPKKLTTNIELIKSKHYKNKE